MSWGSTRLLCCSGQVFTTAIDNTCQWSPTLEVELPKKIREGGYPVDNIVVEHPTGDEDAKRTPEHADKRKQKQSQGHVSSFFISTFPSFYRPHRQCERK